jgi:hypothetical protein
LALGGVEGAVGGGDEVGRRGGVGGVLGDADAQRDGDRGSVRPGEAGGGDLRAPALGQHGRPVRRVLRHHHHELVPSPAPTRIADAQHLQQPLRDAAQDRVAGGVAVRVVELLEAVEVHHLEGQARPVAVGPQHLDREELLHVAARA